MEFVYNGTNTAEGMRTAILAMIDHNLSQARDLSRGTTSVKGSARFAGEVAALTTLRNQVAAIKIAGL